MVRKVAKVGAVKTERNWSRSERKVGVSCMCGLLVARDPGCCTTPRIHPWPKEDAIERAYLPVARSAKPELRAELCIAGSQDDIQRLIREKALQERCIIDETGVATIHTDYSDTVEVIQ